MSYCQIVRFGADGKMREEGPEFRNAWGGAARIWGSLFDAYLKNGEHDSWMRRQQDLWALQDDARLDESERRVLLSTFDRAIIRRDNFAAFAADLRSFVAKHPVPEDSIDHLKAWATWIENSEDAAIGFYGTSVAENPFFSTPTCPTCGQDTAGSVPYDLASGASHFDVFVPDKAEEAR